MKDVLKGERILRTELSTMLGSWMPNIENSSDFELMFPISERKFELQPAAVLVPITFDMKEPMVVFIRRAKNLKQHPGQIAFPGGKVEAGDSSETATAIRECFEEIELESVDIDIIGKLPNHETVTGYLINPFVAMVKNVHKLTPNFAEVSEIFYVPLKFLLNKENMSVQRRAQDGLIRGYYSIPYGPFYIWGATARIIKTFSDLIEKYGKI